MLKHNLKIKLIFLMALLSILVFQTETLTREIRIFPVASPAAPCTISSESSCIPTQSNREPEVFSPHIPFIAEDFMLVTLELPIDSITEFNISSDFVTIVGKGYFFEVEIKQREVLFEFEQESLFAMFVLAPTTVKILRSSSWSFVSTLGNQPKVIRVGNKLFLNKVDAINSFKTNDLNLRGKFDITTLHVDKNTHQNLFELEPNSKLEGQLIIKPALDSLSLYSDILRN